MGLMEEFRSERVLARMLADPRMVGANFHENPFTAWFHSSALVRWFFGWDEVTRRTVDEALNWKATDPLFEIPQSARDLWNNTEQYLQEVPGPRTFQGKTRFTARAELYRCFRSYLRTNKIAYCEKAESQAKKRFNRDPIPRDNLEFSGGKTRELAMRATVDHRLESVLYLMHSAKDNPLDLEALRRTLMADYQSIQIAYGFSENQSVSMSNLVGMYIMGQATSWRQTLQARGPETRVLSATAVVPQ
jgi:hypothetical protein